MKKNHHDASGIRHCVLAIIMLCSTSTYAQERSSSSSSLPIWAKSDVTVPFSITGEGKRFDPTWGLDLAWISEQNVLKGINHMGKDNIGIGRSAFRFTKSLVNDSALDQSLITVLKQRSTIFNKVSSTLPIVLTADQEAGADEYFVKNKSANVEHWAAMINSHVHWMQQYTKHPVVGISPFNEPDYWSTEEGATPAKQKQVAQILKEQYPRCAEIAMVGGNTLNDDKALEWYTSGKAYYDWGNTHQLAGSFDNFAGFFQQLQNDGKVGYADEMHNVGEAMVGLEYGMTVGVWWGFDSRARGEFCQISRHGERLAYAEHRNNWTAASVWRHDDGPVKAFVGSSERQAYTTKYQFVSLDHDVYFDGQGPMRDFIMEMPGGTGYQKGQTNGERVIDITWGDDVAPGIINGTYKIVNRATRNVATATGDNIDMQAWSGDQYQQWVVKPASPRIGGDYSFYDIESVANSQLRMNVLNFSTTARTNVMAYSKNETPSSNEQWYLEYAGNGYYYIRNRETALYLTSESSSTNSGVNVFQNNKLSGTNANQQMWRFLPVDIDYEAKAPAQPVGLAATAGNASVALSWTANTEEDLVGYMVLRSPAGSEQWNTIARKVATNYFTDNTCVPGTSYIYKVKAIDQCDNMSAASDAVEAAPSAQPGLVAQWLMNGDTQDATPNMMDAVTSTTFEFVNGHTEGTKAARFASSKYMRLPYEVADYEEMTISLWVFNMSYSGNWHRIFDFGTDTDHYMFLTASNGSNMRFAIKNGGSEQVVDAPSKLPNSWKHVAVTIGNGRVAIYMDGEEVAASTGITIRPCDIRPVFNYLGRSQFNEDPMFAGYMEDVRIYNYALSADEVNQVMDGGDLSGISVPAVSEADGTRAYTLDGRHSDAQHKGIHIIRQAEGKAQGKKILVR
ncbi:MAG: RICIN domain-containing protein [Prevotella sp.]|nr:RICIN domain-containing protein [Prevotella sp.]